MRSLFKQHTNGTEQRRCLIDSIHAMMRQERDGYRYDAYLPSSSCSRAAINSFPSIPALSNSDENSDDEDAIRPLNASWREKICQWSYNVVDHFDLPRELVAVSLDLFDRYLATCDNRCSGNQALLASLTTLHIAIKLHSERRLKITTLASLSRGQFDPVDIEKMEWAIFQSLGWKLHAPTMLSFISYFTILLPDEVSYEIRKEIFEQSIYIAELSVCDSYFVTLPNSVIAYAAIRNVLDGLRMRSRRFVMDMDAIFHLHDADPMMIAARSRLYAMFEPRMLPSAHYAESAGAPVVTPTSSEDDMDVSCDYQVEDLVHNQITPVSPDSSMEFRTDPTCGMRVETGYDREYSSVDFDRDEKGHSFHIPSSALFSPSS